MRHLLANVITYTIAALLFIGAAAFAWVRSAQLTVSDEYALLARYEPADTAAFAWQRPGKSGYVRNCSNCHGATGQGWDQYPPIAAADTTAAAAAKDAEVADDAEAASGTDDGRDHLIDVMLYGLTSPRWGAPMPPMGHMQDVEIAAVLNYIGAEFLNGAFEPAVRPVEVAARRGRRLSPADVEAARATTASARSRR